MSDATPKSALSYAIGYAERRADGGPIAAADVLAGLAQLGWEVQSACICPAIVKADGAHLVICPASTIAGSSLAGVRSVAGEGANQPSNFTDTPNPAPNPEDGEVDDAAS